MTIPIILAILSIFVVIFIVINTKKYTPQYPDVEVPPMEEGEFTGKYRVMGRWSKDDSLHDCPDECGMIIFEDLQGEKHTIKGINADDNGFENPIIIEPSVIIKKVGVAIEKIYK